MAHWAEAYIGEPYVDHTHDCAEFAARVARERFGRSVLLPGHSASLRAQAAEIDELKNVLATEVPLPEEGDVVMMKCRGRLSHIGVYVAIAGEGWVLHAMKNAGHVVLHRLRDLSREGLVVEGYFRWK